MHFLLVRHFSCRCWIYPKHFKYRIDRPRSLIELRELKLDLLIKQLKCVVLCYVKSSSHEQKSETFDYLNVCKRLYESLANLNNPSDVLKENENL